MEGGTLGSVNERSRDRHCNVEIYLPADMAGHIALEGQGGTRDKRKHFCTLCECHLKHSHMPFQLIRVQSNTTACDLALAHDMSVSLLWVVNAGRDFDSMFEPHELSEEHLGDLTLPLADDVSSEATAMLPVLKSHSLLPVHRLQSQPSSVSCARCGHVKFPPSSPILSNGPQSAQRKAVAGQGISKGKQTPAPITVPAKQGSDQQEEARFVELSCRLLGKFHVVTKQLRSKDPQDASLRDFGNLKNCRDLGARWCMFLPRNRCFSLYLHTVMMHSGAFMTYLLKRNLTIGMLDSQLENSGAERRHQIGKVQI